MNKKKIENQYNKKISLIKKYNQYYYDKSKPLVSDQEYDELRRNILSLELDYKFLKITDSPSGVVGFKP